MGEIPARYRSEMKFGTQIPKTGQIESTVGRHPIHRKKMSTRSRKGKKARTHWKVLENYNAFTLAEFRLETGRTHQIRVHLSSMGHPILGDPLYGGRKRLGSIEPMLLREGLQRLRRQALHAAFLGFIHPISGAYMGFSSPIPDDMEEKGRESFSYSFPLNEMPPEPHSGVPGHSISRSTASILCFYPRKFCPLGAPLELTILFFQLRK